MTLKKSVTKYAAIAAVAITLASCHSKEKVVYLQDLQVDVPEVAVNPTLIKVEPGDKITISVTSSDPELASVFNLITVNRSTRRISGARTGVAAVVSPTTTPPASTRSARRATSTSPSSVSSTWPE